MKWITPLQWDLPFEHEIDYESKIITMGSCFSDHIGKDFLSHGFDCAGNPFGIMFNPVSIGKLLNAKFKWDLSRVVERDGSCVSLDAHSKINSSNSPELITALQDVSAELENTLNKTSDIIVTLGTAWVYKYDGEVVANCHKQPAHLFEKSLLSINEMVSALQEAFTIIFEKNNKVKIFISVSPVRHIKNGLVNDARSKARLLETAHILAETFNNCVYLPAYELVVDVLRDYRFFKADLIHPNDQAVEYVLSFFKEKFFSTKTKEIYELNKRINLLENHKSIISVAGKNDRLKALKIKRDKLLST